MTTENEAILDAIESDLGHFHVKRMAELKGQTAALIFEERSKANPDAEVLSALRNRRMQLEKQKLDLSVTEQEVLEPLRKSVQVERAGGEATFNLRTFEPALQNRGKVED